MQGFHEEAVRQDSWFEEEIEQAKMCSTHMIIYSYHRWFSHSIDEESAEYGEVIPRSVRLRWLKILRHHKGLVLFSSFVSNQACG